MAEQGTEHEHIAAVRWENDSTAEKGEATRQEMIDWIKRGGEIHVRDSRGNDIRVGVVDANPPYIRTYADKVWTDNLLALPRY